MKNINTNEIWMKASVVGSLWAAFEIVFGSFMHNLRLPFAGMIMASIGVLLLTSFSVLWKSKGIFWRAGLICALMKSISPSAVILGPMTGIMLEAFLMQFAVYLIGRNMIAYALGGSFALLSLLIHKVAGMFLSYGFDFVVILDNIIAFSLKSLSITNTGPIQVLYYYAVFLMLVGLLASLIGYYLGTKSAKNQFLPDDSTITFSSETMRHFKSDESKGIYLLIAIVLIIIGSLVLISWNGIVLAFGSTFVFVALSVIYYPNGIKRLYKPSALLNLAVLVLFSIFFFDYQHQGIAWSNEGLNVGLKMMFRAIVVLIGFSIISIELHNPLIKKMLSRKGGLIVYQAMQAGFSVLPSMIETLPTFRDIYTRPIETLSGKIAEVDTFIKYNLKHGSNHH